MSDRLVIVDCESTGLFEKTGEDFPLEYGVAIYDLDFQCIDAWSTPIWSLAIEERTKTMTPFVREMHTKSGLLDEAHDIGLSIRDAEEELVRFLNDRHGVGESDPMVGSSIGFDRNVLRLFAPKAQSLFHYRNIDVSSIKELCRRFNPDVYSQIPEARKLHRSLPDCQDTAMELKFYIDNFCFAT